MSHLVVCGLNYHSTPLAIRERFTIPESCLAHALKALAVLPHIKEAAVLSTCNRTEVYAVVTEVQAGLKEIESFFLSAQKIADHGALRPNFKLIRDDAALHLFRVASGLDSMILGEGQIMSQVKAAYQEAVKAGTAGASIDQLFKLALNCGKRVRSETSMGRRAVSVSSAAVELAREVIGPLGDRRALVIGTGRMGQICLKHLTAERGAGEIVAMNRSASKLERLVAAQPAGRRRFRAEECFDRRHELAGVADLVIVTTSAPSYVLSAEALAGHATGRPLAVIDISVPRNVDPAIARLPGVRLFNADDLASVVKCNLAARESLVCEAESIIFQTLDNYHSWQRSLLVVPTIAELRQKIEAIRQEQMEKSLVSACTDGHTDSGQIEEISRAIVNQILHHPTVQLKATRDYQILKQQAEALRTLFNLDNQHAQDRTGTQAGDSASAACHESQPCGAAGKAGRAAPAGGRA